MQRHYSVLAICLIIFAIFIHADFSEREQTTFEDYLSSNEIEMNSSEKFNIKDQEEDTVAGLSVRRVTAVKDEQVIELKLIQKASSDFAESYIQGRDQEILSMYSDKPAPYKAVPGREVDCRERLLPNITQKQFKEDNYTYYLLYSDKNRNIGECDDEKVFYNVSIVKVYCSDQETIMEMRQYQPTEHQNKSTLVENARC